MDTNIDVLAATGAVLTIGALVLGVRFQRDGASRRGFGHWLLVGVVGAAIGLVAALVFHVLIGWPPKVVSGAAMGCLTVPAVLVLARRTRATTAAGVLVQAIVGAGLIALVGGVYLAVVIGLGRAPDDGERPLIGLSILAAAVATLLTFPARTRLEEWANQWVYGERHAPDEAVRDFGGHMSRAVPMDELLLQLVESLKKTLRLSSAEIWTGTDGHLTCAVSIPDRPQRAVDLDEAELAVVARSRAQGNAWLQVWLPSLLDGRSSRLVRSIAVSHMGALLGLIVVDRLGDGAPFTEDEDMALVELARQVGLALHNVRLDSALQASLEELQERNRELNASRARIVTAADESRRRIERDLHDGAQQHLVALAVKVGLVSQLFESDPATATGLLEELRGDAQAALGELRELAHGIYPPLLRDRGLAEALQTAASRSSLPTTIDAAGLGRFDVEIETAVYFCCLEAMQNSGKHAGPDARVTVAVGNGEGGLWFEVSDDGPGFDAALASTGQGFVNMRDRLGAFDGSLEVRAEAGRGTLIRGEIPVGCVAPVVAP